MRLKVLGAVIGAGVVGYVFFWHYMAGEVEDQIESLVRQQKNNGVSIQYEDLEITGFPYRMELTLTDLKVIKTGSGRRTVRGEIGNVTLVAFPWKINHGVIVSDGGTVRIGGRRSPDFTAVFGKTRASVVVDITGRRVAQASFVLADLTWGAGREKQNNPRSRAEDVKIHLLLPQALASENSMELPLQAKIYLEAKDVEAQEVPVGVFGKKADSVKVDLSLHGEQMPQYEMSSLVQWRDSGGTLAVKNIEIMSGAMDLQLSGEASLDQNLMPLGAFSSTIHGVKHITQVLSGHSAFQQGPASQILAELDKMSVPEESGPHKGEAALKLPVSLQGGLLFLGPIPVLELSPVIETSK